MNARSNAGDETAHATRDSSLGWTVFRHELTELWAGGHVLNLLILFSVLMSITAYLVATNNEIQLLPLNESVLVALLAAITFGLFTGLVLAAESISGERERATLEALLLTPVSRRQIVWGKFLASLSPWPVTLALSAPYLIVLSKGDPILGRILLWGAIVGTLLAITFIGLGMLISIWSRSTKVSLSATLLIYVLALLPAQLPTEFQNTTAGFILSVVNPVDASRRFLRMTLVENQSPGELWIYLVVPAVFIALLLGVLLIYAAPRLGLEPANPFRFGPGAARRKPDAQGGGTGAPGNSAGGNR
ncbi:ABC transporter permease [Defluviimonas sp. WL0024]|uniref:ABC transporter permease n=1 Tax=Albidovulum salinarum TaxID=2984153 RepID=A0ABT2X2M0_9RHOB|nr:ABC transporter permease [Defluviimonas sp. WL0024]MCU9847954.1 ABC transporter permease [Defluviimonas sp. WL0024]